MRRPTDCQPDDVVFASPDNGRKGKRGPNALMNALRKFDANATVHGMRSAFRQWCKVNGHSRELAEEALSHQFEAEVERAYTRDVDQLETRRGLMQRWSDFLDGPEGNVIDLASRRAA
jgi:integrase